MGSAPHETVDWQNNRIKAIYWKLCYGDDQSLPDLNVHDFFTAPEVTLDAKDIAIIVGNNDESLKSIRTDKIGEPMDLAVAGRHVSIVSWVIFLMKLFLFLFLS